jgi:hypothetical protein
VSTGAPPTWGHRQQGRDVLRGDATRTGAAPRDVRPGERGAGRRGDRLDLRQGRRGGHAATRELDRRGRPRLQGARHEVGAVVRVEGAAGGRRARRDGQPLHHQVAGEGLAVHPPGHLLEPVVQALTVDGDPQVDLGPAPQQRRQR